MGELLKRNNICDVLLSLCGIVAVTFDRDTLNLSYRTVGT